MITFRRAVRENVPLIIGLAGASGSGKTYSAMRLASGLANGRPFCVIDTEAGRAKHYADLFTFDHADLRSPFRPSAYEEAITEADKAGYPVIVVDSCSHEHAGEGGLLDWHEEELERMSGGNDRNRDNNNMRAWIKPKMEHKQMVQRLLQVRAHLILCFRAEQKVEMARGEDGKMKIVPKTIASGFSDWIPICEKNMLYELTASFLLVPGKPGIPHPIKLQEQMRKMMDLNSPISEKVGTVLAEWAKGTNKPEPRAAGQAEQGVAPQASDRAPAQNELYGTGGKITKAQWDTLITAIDGDTDLCDLKQMVKEELGLDSLMFTKTTPDSRGGFLLRFAAQAEANGLGKRTKALGL
jgi:hypothetical protein